MTILTFILEIFIHGQKRFYVVLYHNDFSPSNEQQEGVLAYTLYNQLTVIQQYFKIIAALQSMRGIMRN